MAEGKVVNKKLNIIEERQGKRTKEKTREEWKNVEKETCNSKKRKARQSRTVKEDRHTEDLDHIYWKEGNKNV